MLERDADKKPMVVVVDDDITHGRLFELVSDQLGIDIKVCRSCDEAISALSVVNADLVLMDIRMPEVDGYACTAKIRRNPGMEQLPVVAVTAMVQPGTRESCMNAQMNDYLSKPFSMEELKSILAKWIEGHHQNESSALDMERT